MNALLAIEWRQVGVIAFKEFSERIRNRWVLVVALVFTVFALVIAYFGLAQQGAVGFHGIEVTIASLVSLVIYLIPLIALILGYDAIVGERERGSLELLLSMPITRFELLLGKFLGLSAALAFSTLAGFGLVALVLSSQFSADAMFHYIGFVLSAILMGMAYLSMAVAISVVATNRTSASGIAIALWFVFVLVFDLLLLGGLVVTGGKYTGEVFPYLLLLNPSDIFRIINMFGYEEVKSMYGLATVFPEKLSNPWLLTTIMLAWIVTPLSLASWRFK